jgi:integrase
MPSTANPILETIETIKGYPSTLKLFKCGESRYWQVSLYVDKTTVRKSTRTEQKGEAIAFAKKFFTETLLKQAQQQPLTKSSNFAIVAEDLFKEDQGRVDRKERSETLVSDARYIYEADLLKFFGKFHVKDINYQKLNEYTAHLKTRGKKPVGTGTIKHHFVLINKILKHAHRLGYIDKLPFLPTIQTIDNPRGWFTEPEYDSLLKTIDEMIKEKVVVRWVPATLELKYLITFLVNSFLRPADLKDLKNKHIAAVTGTQRYLRIQAQAKVKTQQVISMEAAVDIYSALIAFNKPNNKAEDFVFYPEFKGRPHAMKVMQRLFNEALQRAELKTDPNGQPRTLYSLRHTSIMNRLLNGDNVDLFTLATNCRTSVDQITRFYGSHLTAEMNVAKLIGTKKTVIQGSSLEGVLPRDDE